MATEGLIGRWRLSSYVARESDVPIGHPFGEHPHGTLVYTPAGWMTAQIAAGERPLLGAEDPFAAGENELARAFLTYLAYSGTYELGDGVVHHRVAMCSLPDWVGTVQTRYFELTGDELLLRTPPLKVGGERAVHELRWTREEGGGWS